MRFQNGSNKVAIELRVVQFWSEIILVISNRTSAQREFDFEIRPICTPLSSITIINTRKYNSYLQATMHFLFSGASEGPPSGAPYSYRKEKETLKWIFSWLSWLAVLLVGAHARRQRQWRRRSRATWRPCSK